ncbi:MAG: SH3 domain-containing protein [Acidimicrobiia bacterium]|nr:SH3 domain-containing protein [Acidimicrobiia bacterium]
MVFTATRSHEPPERSPLQVRPGDVVDVGERDTEWPEFVFVTAAVGSGWVPARHLSTDSGPAVVLAGYDTTELAVSDGDALTVVERDDESGWWWCRSTDGDEGWVPIEVLQPKGGPIT